MSALPPGELEVSRGCRVSSVCLLFCSSGPGGSRSRRNTGAAERWLRCERWQRCRACCHVTMAGVARHADHFFSHDLFYKQAADGTLPAFSWISPPHEAADHPCMDLAKGERLLKDMYEALRGGKGWSKTLFMVTYDDYGGFDDQIPFPDAVPDHSPCLVWNKLNNVSIDAPTKCPAPGMNFSKLGHRGVCAMMSPWVGKRAIFQRPKAAPPPGQPPRQFDHTSMLATAKSLFQLGGFLTDRDAWAGNLEELLLDVPRQPDDMPMHLPNAPKPSSPWAPWPPRGPTPAPPAPPPPPAAAVPAGKRWQCFNGRSVRSTPGAPAWTVRRRTLTGVDSTRRFTDLHSCEDHCNGCYNASLWSFTSGIATASATLAPTWTRRPSTACS